MQPIKNIEIYQGESWGETLKPVYNHEFAIDASVSCVLTVKKDKNTKITKTITDASSDNLYYKPSLMPAETSSLDEGEYSMVITVADSDTDFEHQFRYALTVKK